MFEYTMVRIFSWGERWNVLYNIKNVLYNMKKFHVQNKWSMWSTVITFIYAIHPDFGWLRPWQGKILNGNTWFDLLTLLKGQAF
jgi:hypothetical protein